jgi:RNase P subunit RPR2
MLFGSLNEQPKRKTSLSKSEWEAKKKILQNKCVVCGKTEKSVGKLIKAHVKARSKGGNQVLPMCPNCHWKYDHAQEAFTASQRKKLGLSDRVIKKLSPAKKPKRKNERFGFL